METARVMLALSTCGYTSEAQPPLDPTGTATKVSIMPIAKKPAPSTPARRPAKVRPKAAKKSGFDFMARLRADFPDGPPAGAPLSKIIAESRGTA